ncbi:hypothetical protein IFO70_08700 [Phormidium tenue FACHB-886]|nr:hypothetical protein [Phormidium tenue FACHB-886]
MAFTSQTGLDALLASLEGANSTTRIRQQRFRGTARNDVASGDSRNNIADGRQGDDILLGKAGDDRLSGSNGNDVLFGGDGIDILAGGNNQDLLYGEAGDDQLNGGNGGDTLDGGVGVDALLGGSGDDTLVGGDGADTLTGEAGRDRFVYTGNVFANGTPALAGQTGIRVLNTPDIIRDYTIGEDQFALDSQALDLDRLVFQKGAAAQLDDGANVLVLNDPFAAAGAAARAIANNAAVTTKEGVFVYFNSTLGLNRVVYSRDLANGGDISVLANLDNQRGQAGATALANFTAADFTLV